MYLYLETQGIAIHEMTTGMNQCRRCGLRLTEAAGDLQLQTRNITATTPHLTRLLQLQRSYRLKNPQTPLRQLPGHCLRQPQFVVSPLLLLRQEMAC